MKKILFLVLMILSGSVNADDIFLEFNKECSTTGDALTFECKKSTKERTLIFTENKKWYGKNPNSESVWELEVIKADKYVIILNNPVFFSGTSVIHLMKATGKFYWSEFAYSEILKESEATVRYGNIRKVYK